MENRFGSLLGKVTEAAQNAGSAAGSTMRMAGQKAGTAVDTARLNVKIHELNTDISNLLADAGRIVYEAHLGGQSDQVMLQRIFTQLDEKNAQVMELRSRIDDLNSSLRCPCCGTGCVKGDRFCKVCGFELK